MRLLFLDDSTQRKCQRERMGRLVAVGGIAVEADIARELDTQIDELCRDRFGFPERAPFKWSPARDHWMRDNLVGDRRVEFFNAVLELARTHGAIGQVTIADSSKSTATGRAESHEMDVLVMALERFSWLLNAGELGLVIAARPSGGRGDEDHFLAGCAEVVTNGTDYAKFDSLVMNVLTMPFANSRLLQVADLIVSITTALVAGHLEYTEAVFPAVRALLRERHGSVGGAGVKIHPDYSYVNLYHWALGDETFWRGNNGYPLPHKGRAYFGDGMKY